MYRLIVWYYRFFDRSWRRPVDLKSADDGSDKSSSWNQRIGDIGEDLARRWMWAHGMKVLYRQYVANGGGEVDIVARHGEVLIFCEVKTRTSRQFGRPADAVDQEKQKLITRGAHAWIRELGYTPLLFRFDIIEVNLTEGEIAEINHIENAFKSAPRLLA